MYGLTPTLKNEIVAIAPKGRVNSVNPGWVATPLAEETLKDRNFVARALVSVNGYDRCVGERRTLTNAYQQATTPLQKVAKPEDVARQVAVISSPALSGHVNGVNLQVDGGMEGRLLFPPSW